MLGQYPLPEKKEFIGFGGSSREKAYRETLRMITEADELPDALLCANDDMAFGCMQTPEAGKSQQLIPLIAVRDFGMTK